MSAATGDPGSENLGTQLEAAERRLREAVEAAAAAEERATAEISALEADLEKERQGREQAIADADARLAELEAQAEAAEQRVAEAERRAASRESAGAEPGSETGARESAAAWLRGQIEAIRREAGGR